MHEPRSSFEGECLEVLQQISQGFSASQELTTCAQSDPNKKKKKRKRVQAYCLLNNINKHSKKKENFFLTFRNAFNIGYETTLRKKVLTSESFHEPNNDCLYSSRESLYLYQKYTLII